MGYGVRQNPDPQKTKICTVTNSRSLDFVGFKISQKYIGIKDSNIKKFKIRIEEILKTSDFKKKTLLELLKLRMSYKYFGNEYKSFKCQTSGNFEKTRLSFDNVLILPTKVMENHIIKGRHKMSDTVIAQFYVAITRSKNNVAILSDKSPYYDFLNRWEEVSQAVDV